MKAWADVTSEPLRFPIGDRVYEVAPLSIDDGLLAMRILHGDEPDWTARPVIEFYQLIMGETWDRMRADGVSLDAATRAGNACLADLQNGREAAERIWEAGIDPEALAAWMAATRTSQTSTGTESENETPSPASTRTTTNEPPSSSPAPKRARSRGPRSSTASNSSAPTGPPSTDSG